jgi:DnaA-homolog protein
MAKMQQVPLPLTPQPQHRFDNFLATGAADQVLKLLQGGPPRTPVYLWGPPGCGKTHLLHAAAQHWQAQGERVTAFDADEPAPWPFDEAARAVLIDDCERLDAQQQHAAFTLFVQAETHAVGVVAAGGVPPVDLPVREDLRTRLGWGLVFALAPPSEEQVRALLRREADRRGILLSDEVIAYLLTRFERHLGVLTRLLDRLDRYSLAHQRAVTVPLLKQMLAEEGA